MQEGEGATQGEGGTRGGLKQGGGGVRQRWAEAMAGDGGGGTWRVGGGVAGGWGGQGGGGVTSGEPKFEGVQRSGLWLHYLGCRV